MERGGFPGRSQRSERFPCGAPWAGAPWLGRTVLCSAPNGLSSWPAHAACGTPLPRIVTTLGNFTSMQTISPQLELKRGESKPEDQKHTGRTSFTGRNTRFLPSPLRTPVLLGAGTLDMSHQVIRPPGHVALVADTPRTTCFRAKQKKSSILK